VTSTEPDLVSLGTDVTIKVAMDVGQGEGSINHGRTRVFR